MSSHNHEWPMLPLADVVKPDKPIVYGIVQAGPECPGGVPYIKSIDVRGVIDPSSLSRTSREIADRYRRSVVRPGDIVFSLRGNIGELSIVPVELVEANLTQGTARISVNGRALNEYVAFALQEPSLQRKIARLGKGSTFQEISLEALRKIEIPLPPLPEQRKIAEILRTWDAAIEKLEALRAAKERRARALAHTFLRRAGKDIGATTKPLSKLARIVKGVQLNKIDIADGEYPVWNGGITPSGFHNEWNTEGGTITISEGGNSCGFVNLGTQRFWLGGHCYALCDLLPEIDREFLLHSLKAREAEIMRLRVGSGLPNIQRADLERFLVLVPPYEDQRKIARLLDTARQEITLINAEIEAHTRQKRGLMQKLLTGEWRVKVEAN